MTTMAYKELKELIIEAESILQTAKNNLNTIVNARKALTDLKKLDPSLNLNLDELEDSIRTELRNRLKNL
jgi:hypothetical protein